MGDVRTAAREYGMTLDEFIFQTEPEELEGVDWNNEQPTETAEERLERLNFEINVFVRYGCEIPDRLLTEYYDAIDKWAEQESEAQEAMNNAPIGDIEDYATGEDIQL